MIAPITSIELARPPEPIGRFIVRFREYAEINVPNAWPAGHRNPVMYANASQFVPDVATLKFTSGSTVESLEPSRASTRGDSDPKVIAPLSIVAAKKALAAYYEVDSGSIEIVIRA